MVSVFKFILTSPVKIDRVLFDFFSDFGISMYGKNVGFGGCKFDSFAFGPVRELPDFLLSYIYESVSIPM